MIKYDLITYDGKLPDYRGRQYWIIEVNPSLSDLKDYDYDDGLIQRVGTDNMGEMKVAYLLVPAEAFTIESSGKSIPITPWTEQDVVDYEPSINKFKAYCRVCQFIQKHATPSKRAVQRIPGGVEVTTVEREEIPTTKLLTPKTITKIGSTFIDTFFEPLGSLTINALLGMWLQYMSGTAKDEGVKKTYEEMASECIRKLDIPPEKQSILYDNMHKAYTGFSKSGNIGGLGQGFIRSFKDVMKDQQVSLKKETKCSTTITAGFIQANGNQLIG